jgi:hypothetical protein
VGYHSLTTTTRPSNVNLPSSEQRSTARLSARKVSVVGRNRAQDPLVMDDTIYSFFNLVPRWGGSEERGVVALTQESLSYTG